MRTRPPRLPSVLLTLKAMPLALMTGTPIMFKGQHPLNAGLGILILLLIIMFVASGGSFALFALIALVALALGLLLIIPIGGADMPVVVSMLNSYSGWAASGIGFTIGNLALIEVGEDREYRYRLYGTNFVFRFGVEMTGRTVEDLPPEQSAAIREDYDAVVDSVRPLSRRYTSRFDIIDLHRRLDSQRLETWERLVLPLANGGDAVAMLMVAAYHLATETPPDP